jgi:hypothetical protein
MQTVNKTYRFRGKVLPDGHLSVPDEISRAAGSEFEVTITSVDAVKESTARYLAGKMERRGSVADMPLDSADLEKAVAAAFGTADIDAILQSVRR